MRRRKHASDTHPGIYLKEYVALYGKTTWSMSVYGSNTALIEHYISPIIGSMKLSDVTARGLEKYYMGSSFSQ